MILTWPTTTFLYDVILFTIFLMVSLTIAYFDTIETMSLNMQFFFGGAFKL